MRRPTSWDDTPALAIDDRLLLELMVLVDAQPRQPRDADGAGSVERAHVRHRTDAEINRHLDHLAGLGLITARVVSGHRRRVCALTDAGRAWGAEHFGEILRGEG